MRKARKSTVEALVNALFADYPRREEAIREKKGERRFIMECVYLNKRIFEAAAGVCGTALARSFIKEIGLEIGYAKSEITVLSESVYKDYKRRIRIAAARGLHLI